MARSPKPRSDARRIAGIEGLRAIAAAAVLAYHVWYYGAPGGHPVAMGPLTNVFDNLRSGVTLFFALSGFLLYRPFAARAWRAEPRPLVRNYLVNRALRILPAYWTVLIVVGVALEPQLLEQPSLLLRNMLFLQNYDKHTIFGAGIVPAWSLCVEVVFYLVLPFLGLLAVGIARRTGPGSMRALLAPVALLVATGIAAKAVETLFHGSGREIWDASFPIHADWFAWGMVVAALHVRFADGGGRRVPGWRALALVVALCLGIAGAKLDYGGELTEVQSQSVTSVGCALLLAVVVFPAPGSRLVRTLESRVLYATGVVSYSVFLWHDPFLRALRGNGLTAPGPAGLVVNLLVLAAITAVLSAVSYRLVERPALALKRAWRRSERPAPEAAPADVRVASR